MAFAKFWITTLATITDCSIDWTALIRVPITFNGHFSELEFVELCLQGLSSFIENLLKWLKILSTNPMPLISLSLAAFDRKQTIRNIGCPEQTKQNISLSVCSGAWSDKPRRYWVWNFDKSCEIFHSGRTTSLPLLLKGRKGYLDTAHLPRKSKGTTRPYYLPRITLKL